MAVQQRTVNSQRKQQLIATVTAQERKQQLHRQIQTLIQVYTHRCTLMNYEHMKVSVGVFGVFVNVCLYVCLYVK